MLDNHMRMSLNHIISTLGIQSCRTISKLPFLLSVIFANGPGTSGSSIHCLSNAVLLPTPLSHPEIDGLVHLIERLESSVPLPQNPTLNPPRRSFSSLVSHELLRRHSKDIIQFLQSSLFRLRNKEEDHNEGADVQAGVETKCARNGEFGEDSWETDSQDCCPEEACGNCPSHTNFTVGQGKHFGAVGEGDGTFSWT